MTRTHKKNVYKKNQKNLDSDRHAFIQDISNIQTNPELIETSIVNVI